MLAETSLRHLLTLAWQVVQTDGLRKTCSTLPRNQDGVVDQATLDRVKLRLAEVNEKCRDIVGKAFQVLPRRLAQESRTHCYCIIDGRSFSLPCIIHRYRINTLESWVFLEWYFDSFSQRLRRHHMDGRSDMIPHRHVRKCPRLHGLSSFVPLLVLRKSDSRQMIGFIAFPKLCLLACLLACIEHPM